MAPAYWIFVLLAVAAYCAAQAVRDFRQGHYVWSAAAAACAAVLLLSPIHSEVVKFDLPAPARMPT